MTITIPESRTNEHKKFLTDPTELVRASNTELFSLGTDVLTPIQLAGVQKRFEFFYPRIKALKKLADEQGITQITSLEQVASILFQHTVYKSYPLQLVEKHRFDKLTTHDLSRVDTAGCKSIDSWLERLEEQTDLQVVHSTGTSGKLSFLPRSAAEMESFKDALYLFIEALTGVNPHKVQLPVFFPGFRNGRQLVQRVLSYYGPLLAGSEAEYHTAMPGFMSADFMSLAGRLQAAKAKGELGKLQMIKALTYNKGELLKMKKHRPKWMKEFFENMVTNYQGRQVFLMGPLTALIEAALEGEETGLNAIFAPDSAIITGGGLKGQDVPADWYDRICQFYGVSAIRDGYGMTETTGYCPSCEHDHYHIYPFFIPFIFDTKGNLLPQQGTQTGRFGFYDLLAESYWGGFITGDEVTIHWDDPCACGRQGPWLEKHIQRFSEKQDGEDKISCAGAQQAYDNFLDYILELVED
ncbi:MAG: hypothetical protein ACFFC7_18740 [Candidatus Hermodarchaeota archaeon]